jgi:SAM-dependent methyltransferase
MPETPYDRVAYPSRPFQQTHPARMALPAALLGLPFAPAATARVLEIGCGEGGNIIPLALSYPDAEIIGFDLAETAIAKGRRVVESLGLANIDLRALDILAADPAALGRFDYIIVHGVYSWVPEPVRQGILRLIREALKPEGLAFVSYNALPGCHLRLMLREMILRHLDGVEGFEARLAATREFLTFYVANAPDDDQTTTAIKNHCQSMLDRDPRVLFHDELGPVYQPLYLQEFVAETKAWGLEVLAEASGQSWREDLFPSSRGKAVAALVGEDPIDRRQYLDFLTARAFRQSILHHAGRPTDRVVDQRRVRGLWASAGVRCVENMPDLASPKPLRFEFASGAAIALDAPVLKRALFAIAQAWPSGIGVADLPDDPDVDEGLLQLFCAGHLDLTVSPPPCSRDPGERPVSSPLARLQLEGGATTVTNLDHAIIALEDAAVRRFVALLDGSRSRDELTATIMDEGLDLAEASALVARQLSGLARLGLLVR